MVMRKLKTVSTNTFFNIYSLEFFLSLAPEVSDQPLRGESILRWHPPAHHCVEECFSLACVKTKHLQRE